MSNYGKRPKDHTQYERLQYQCWRSWMSNTLFGQLPSDLQAVIKSVNKLTSAGNNSPSIVTSSDKLWLPSYTEVGFAHNPSYSPGGEGSAYPLFISDASRIKTVNGSAAHWWLRSPYATNTTNFDNVNSNGSYNNNNASNTYAVAAGLCAVRQSNPRVKSVHTQKEYMTFPEAG
ncbi:MAG: DUF6273 domain-containing protein [Oscillospiraceae bacterium]